MALGGRMMSIKSSAFVIPSSSVCASFYLCGSSIELGCPIKIHFESLIF